MTKTSLPTSFPISLKGMPGQNPGCHLDSFLSFVGCIQVSVSPVGSTTKYILTPPASHHLPATACTPTTIFSHQERGTAPPILKCSHHQLSDFSTCIYHIMPFSLPQPNTLSHYF